MTVCIAATCESAKKIVVAADRMLTFQPPTSLEFETEENKIEELSPSCVAMASGNTGPATEIIQKTRKFFGGNTSPAIDSVFETVKKEYTLTRLTKIDENVVSAILGLDYQKFVNRGGTLPQYLQPQAQTYQQLSMAAQQFNLGVDLIVAGIDSHGTHIGVITHPGTFVPLDKLGYGSIGSGGIHATIYLSLHGQTSQKQLWDTLYDVFAAKKISEAAPGVGQATDIAVVEEGRIVRCGEPVKEELERLFSETHERSRPEYDKLKDVYNGLHKS